MIQISVLHTSRRDFNLHLLIGCEIQFVRIRKERLGQQCLGINIPPVAYPPCSPKQYLCRYLIHFFLEILRTFTGIFLCVLRSEYSFSVGGTFLSYNRSYGFFKNRSFGGVEPPEGLEIEPDILIQIFLEIRILTATGAGCALPGWAEPKWTNFSRES